MPGLQYFNEIEWKMMKIVHYPRSYKNVLNFEIVDFADGLR
jgi:hypothetical protein